MENDRGHRIETVAQLQALLGEPNPMTPKKLFSALDDAAIDFIRRSPFLVLATADLAACENAVGKAGVRIGGGVLVAPAAANGVLLVFVKA